MSITDSKTLTGSWRKEGNGNGEIIRKPIDLQLVRSWRVKVRKLTSVCLVIGLSFRKRGLSMISHTWCKKKNKLVYTISSKDIYQWPKKRRWKRSFFISFITDFSLELLAFKVFPNLFMDVYVWLVWRTACGVPTQELHIFEDLFNWQTLKNNHQ